MGKLAHGFFAKQEAVKRSSKNRPRGTLVRKPYTCNRKVFLDMVIDKLLPNMEAKWPVWVPRKVRIQHDGVTSHPKPGKDARLEAKLER